MHYALKNKTLYSAGCTGKGLCAVKLLFCTSTENSASDIKNFRSNTSNRICALQIRGPYTFQLILTILLWIKVTKITVALPYSISNRFTHCNKLVRRPIAGSGIFVRRTVAKIRNIEVSISQTSVKVSKIMFAKTHESLSLQIFFLEKTSVAKCFRGFLKGLTNCFADLEVQEEGEP